jgi:hypothetical protein
LINLKDNSVISRMLIIAAATVVIFGRLLGKAETLLEDAIRLFEENSDHS